MQHVVCPALSLCSLWQAASGYTTARWWKLVTEYTQADGKSVSSTVGTHHYCL